jgi:hypothetical protein
MTGASHAALTVARSRLAIHRELATTPGRLRLAAALLAIGATVFGVVATHAADRRQQAVLSVGETEPLLVRSVELSESLSDAHAMAASSFLVRQPESPGSHPRYIAELKRAGDRVTELARARELSAAGRAAVRSITQTLPVYAGLIGAARANDRQGLPLGGAYLRRAAKTMNQELLPPARKLYDLQAQRLMTQYRPTFSTWMPRAVMLAGCAMLALLAGTQVYVGRATRRIVNPGLALASVVLLGLVVWILVALSAQKREMVRARSAGSVPVKLLTVARSQVSRAQASESVALADRGAAEHQSKLADVDVPFQALTRPISSGRGGRARGSGGLLDQAAVTGHRTAAIDAIYAAYRRYLGAHRLVVEQEIRGNFKRAVKLAVGTQRSSSTTRTAATLNKALDREVAVAEARFHHFTSRSRAKLAGLVTGIPLLTALCGVLALVGVRQRLKEYR